MNEAGVGESEGAFPSVVIDWFFWAIENSVCFYASLPIVVIYPALNQEDATTGDVSTNWAKFFCILEAQVLGVTCVLVDVGDHLYAQLNRDIDY